MNLQKTAYFFISAMGLIAALFYGKTLLLPFVLGLLLWYIMHGTKASLDNVPFIKKKFEKTRSVAIILSEKGEID